MSKNNSTLKKIAGLCGIIGPIVALLFISLAISNSLAWFRWADNALSDLGHQGKAGTFVAMIFNSGLMISALLNIVFTAGLIQLMHKKMLGFVGTLVFLLANISLFAIGVFPETAGHIHFYVSVAFFALFPFALFFIGGSMIKEAAEKTLGFCTLLFGIFAALSGAPLLLVGAEDIAVHELLAALSGLMWQIVLGYRLFRQSVLT